MIYDKLRNVFLKFAPLRRFLKKINVYMAFLADAKEFNRYCMEESYLVGDYTYRLHLLVHSLEKGMCVPNPRPFGQSKCEEIVKILKR